MICTCTHAEQKCSEPLDYGGVELECSKPRGHGPIHVACSPLADRHQDAVWGRDGRVHDHPFPEVAGVLEGGEQA